MQDKCELCPNASEYEFNGRLLCSACVSAEAAKVKPEVSLVDTKPRRKRGKDIDQVQVRKDYSGEASPYWDYLMNQGWQNEKGHLLEDSLANPDVLPEEASLYYRPLSEDGELRMDILQDVMEELTPLQKRVLTLCASSRDDENYTTELAARELGITRRALRTMLDRIRVVVKQRYTQRKNSAKWQK